jgi:hypothetical protein
LQISLNALNNDVTAASTSQASFSPTTFANATP